MRYVVHTQSGAVYNLGGPNLTWERVNPEKPVSSMEETKGFLRTLPVVVLGRQMMLELAGNVHEVLYTTRVVPAECWDD